jgi:hypothetical protein
MPKHIPFADVLKRLESGGWRLERIWKPYRVFAKAGHLPILVRVEDRDVDADDFTKIMEILEREEQGE